MLSITLFLLRQQWKLFSWSIALHQTNPLGPLRVVTDSFFVPFQTLSYRGQIQ